MIKHVSMYSKASSNHRVKLQTFIDSTLKTFAKHIVHLKSYIGPHIQ